MRILLSNDDGYQAPGIVCLAQALRTLAQVTVVAPDRNRSGASNSLTLENPIRATHVQSDVISVDGTPVTDFESDKVRGWHPYRLCAFGYHGIARL